MAAATTIDATKRLYPYFHGAFVDLVNPTIEVEQEYGTVHTHCKARGKLLKNMKISLG